ncbi:MAG: MBL fold metallo-hydrolase [Prolixibacteraceae bacterium]|jgi:L-ascorbate metabolism protein UlaG (beta-lactamase superfamily)|nr:MBL fold metallo-hydrolase [Prolixibacteraceae bacterium]
MKRKRQLLIITVLIFVIGGIVVMKISPGFGGKVKGERLERIKKSPNFRDGIFQNPVRTSMQGENFSFWAVMREFIRKTKGRTPGKAVPAVPVDKNLVSRENKGIRVIWLGHSTTLIEMDGVLVLTDPVFSERTSPFSFAGTRRFDSVFHYDIENLPEPDLVIISHDHYDHLDRKTVLKLKDKKAHFVMPLGVGAHFDRWGFSSDRYTELDWDGEFLWQNKLKITATPARHFTGRGLTDRFKTLWASWVLKSGDSSVFFSGDSGYFLGFKDIGSRFGPFDLCILECGQYNDGWPYIHMAPEETAQAHLDLKGKLLLPVHWGKFRLSLHHWTEPVERILKAASANGSRVTTPRIGEQIIIGKHTPQINWWSEID